MSETKINFNLTGVPHTLVFPLLGRVVASRDPEISFSDPHAVKALESLNYDFQTLENQMLSFEQTTAWAAERASFFDNEVCRFIAKHPNGTVVNLGAGLETCFYRVDNGQLTWVDLDMPEVIALRKQLFTANERIHAIAKSVLDFSWIDEVKQFSAPVFIQAAGLLMYLTETEVKSIFLELANKLPNSDLLFDCIAKKDLAEANEMFKSFDLENVRFQWGMDEATIKSWSDRIEITENACYTNILSQQLQLLPNRFHGYFTKVHFRNT